MIAVAEHVESCINHLVNDFKSLAINFVVEADLEAELFKLLRRGGICRVLVPYSGKKRKICLVHTQWPIAKFNNHHRLSRSGAFDIVIWKRNSLSKNPNNYWGIGPLNRAHNINLQVVIEIKHRRNSLSHPDAWCKRDIKKLNDAMKMGKTEHVYYLVFIDEDIDTARKKTRFTELTNSLKKQSVRCTPNIKILCASRTDTFKSW